MAPRQLQPGGPQALSGIQAQQLSLPDTTVTAWMGLKHCVEPRHNSYSMEGPQALCGTRYNSYSLEGPQALCGTQTVTAWRASSTVWHPDKTVKPARHNNYSLEGPQALCGTRYNSYSLKGPQALCGTQTVTAWRASSTEWHPDTTVKPARHNSYSLDGPQALCGTKTQQL